MVCIYCASPTEVTNSRPQRRTNSIWRRRSCQTCGSVFTTHETADLSTAVAVRYSAKDLRAFSRDRLFLSLYESNRHRPTALEDAEGLARTITSLLLQQQSGGVITREEIISIVTAVLERFDGTATALYKAYHPTNS